MEWSYLVNFLSEMAYLITVLAIFIAFSLFKGRQFLINVTMGLYMALLISMQFPSYEYLFGGLNTSGSVAFGKIGFFLVIATLTTMLFYRIMPDEFQEKKFESFGKKLLLSIGATILVMIFSFNVLPVSEFLVTGTPIQSLFAPEVYFFWWLLVPLVILYIV